eukprot:4842139-Prymnesium_polylepis.2
MLLLTIVDRALQTTRTDPKARPNCLISKERCPTSDEARLSPESCVLTVTRRLQRSLHRTL